MSYNPNNNPEKYILSYNSLKELLEDTQSTVDKLSVARDYTDNIPELLHMLDMLHPHSQRTMKIKITKLTIRIKAQIKGERNQIDKILLYPNIDLNTTPN